jgi:hypothetical protein
VNFAAQSAKGKQIDSAQFNFAPPDLAYIANNYIHLDHEQQMTASGETTPYGGTGVGVGAPQYGPRRGLFFGLSKSLGAAR